MEAPKPTKEESAQRRSFLLHAVNLRTKKLQEFRTALSRHLIHDKNTYGFDEFVLDVIENEMVLWSKNEYKKTCTFYYIPLDKQITIDYSTYYQLDQPADYTRNSIHTFERDFLHICFEAEIHEWQPHLSIHLPDAFQGDVQQLLRFRYNNMYPVILDDSSPDKENTDPIDGFVLN